MITNQSHLGLIDNEDAGFQSIVDNTNEIGIIKKVSTNDALEVAENIQKKKKVLNKNKLKKPINKDFEDWWLQ